MALARKGVAQQLLAIVERTSDLREGARRKIEGVIGGAGRAETGSGKEVGKAGGSATRLKLKLHARGMRRLTRR